MSEYAVQTQALRYSYPDGTTMTFPDMARATGEHTLLLGPSGAGKSTLLHLMSGLLRGYSGSIKVAGRELASMADGQLDIFRGKAIGIVFQKAHFIPSISVKENICLPNRLIGEPTDPEFLLELTDHLEIGHLIRKMPRKLSVGELQRASIARALMTKPAVILADEPTSALDDANCERVVQLLRTQAEFCGSTLFVVTHDTRLTGMFPNPIILESARHAQA